MTIFDQVKRESDGWIEHDGSGVPEEIKRLPADARVLRRQRRGCETELSAALTRGESVENLWLWGKHDGNFIYEGDFIAYRILDQAAAQGSQESGAQGEQESVRAPVAAAPIDQNARMLENDQRGGAGVLSQAARSHQERGQISSRPTHSYDPVTGCHPERNLLMVADPDRRGVLWGAR